MCVEGVDEKRVGDNQGRSTFVLGLRENEKRKPSSQLYAVVYIGFVYNQQLE